MFLCFPDRTTRAWRSGLPLTGLLLAIASHAAAPSCPEIPNLRLEGQSGSHANMTEQQLRCDYVESADLPWPSGRLIAVWQDKGELLACTELCGDASTLGLSPLIHDEGKAAYVLYDVLGISREGQERWRIAARKLLAEVAARATSCARAAALADEPDFIASGSTTPAAPEPGSTTSSTASAPTGKTDEGKKFFELGDKFRFGRGVTQDLAKAVEHYRRGAALGNADCEYSLAYVHQFGKGVSRNSKEACRWAIKAAKRGHADAIAFMGDRYYYGQGVPKDLTRAARWYARAAKQGSSSGMYSMGWVLAKGEGVTKDETQAVSWYRKAAAKGNRNAIHEIGVAYYYGRGVTKNLAEAARLYRQAAGKGVSSAQYWLGYVLENGKGVSRDRAQAITWYQKAARQGHKHARSHLKKLGKTW